MNLVCYDILNWMCLDRRATYYNGSARLLYVILLVLPGVVAGGGGVKFIIIISKLNISKFHICMIPLPNA